MTHLRFFSALLTVLVLASMQASEAKTKRASAVAYVPPASAVVAEYVPSRWFRDLDQIEADSKIPIKERDRGAYLMMRALAGVSEPAEYAEAHAMLVEIAARYRKVGVRIGQLANAEETQDIRRGYVAYYNGMAKLCEDCAALRTIDASKGQYRALTSDEANLLVKRKFMLEQLFELCRSMDIRLRLAHGLLSTAGSTR